MSCIQYIGLVERTPGICSLLHELISLVERTPGICRLLHELIGLVERTTDICCLLHELIGLVERTPGICRLLHEFIGLQLHCIYIHIDKVQAPTCGWDSMLLRQPTDYSCLSRYCYEELSPKRASNCIPCSRVLWWSL